MSVKSRAVAARGVLEYRLRNCRGLPIRSRLVCADNSGAKMLMLIQVSRYGGRLKRLPAANVGDLVTVTVKKGTPELRKQIMKAIIVRQKFPIRRPDGTRVVFEDNAAVLVTPEGELKGTEIRGPVARESADRWPKVAALASTVI